jgi:hypothetical protein
VKFRLYALKGHPPLPVVAARLWEYVFMRTTVELPDPVFRKMKAAAALQGSSIKQFVQRAVERELLSELRPKRQKLTLPLIRGREKRILSLTNAQIDEILAG